MNFETWICLGCLVCLGFILIQGIRIYLDLTTVRDTGSKGIKEVDRYIETMNQQSLSGHINIPAMKQDKEGLPEDKQWQHQTLNQFYKTYVSPNIKGLSNRGVLSSIQQICSFLDQHGDCPSVVANDIEKLRWDENKVNANGYEVLSRISLLDHSINVATILIEDRKNQNIDYREMLGNLLILGLGHDLGKIPKYSTKPYKKMDHPFISQEILSSILPEKLHSKDRILAAVRDHHFPADKSNDLTVILKSADHKARIKEIRENANSLNALLGRLESETEPDKNKQMELFQHKKNTAVEEIDLSWLDVQQLIARIADHINVVKNNIYRAFSFKGLVYVQPDLIFEITAKLGVENNHFELMAYGNEITQKNHILLAVRTLLDEHIPSQIGKTFIGQKYRIITKDGKSLSPGFYLPIKISAFNILPSVLEDRKKGSTYIHNLLYSIKYVEVYSVKNDASE